MNILYVHNVGKIGGAERVTLDIIRGLDRSSHTAFLVTPEEGPFLYAARELGAHACSLDIHQPDAKKPLQTLIDYRSWLKFLRENEIDLIHTGDLFVTRTLIRPANKLGIPLVCHIHFPIEESALSWIFKTRADECHFVYCSQELHDKIAPRIKTVLTAASHQIIHNGVDVDLFKPFLPKKGLLPSDRTNVGIVANLQERKGHLDLIEAISRLYPKNLDILVHVIGGDLFGESREQLLKERVEELGLQENFVFHGQVDNVRDYLNELDILVCASHEEAFPVSILEAMAFKLPIVSTNVNGIPEAISDGQTGLLISPNLPDELATALNQIIGSRLLAERLRKSAREKVEEKFCLNRFNMKIALMYRCIDKKSDSEKFLN